MTKVVITGRGLVTPLGNGLAANEKSLREARSGIVFMPEWQEQGLESQVAGLSDENPPCPLFEKKNLRFMSPNSRMAVAAAYEAMTEAGYTMETLPRTKMAVINGCAGSSYGEVYKNASSFDQTRRLSRVSPFSVPKIMPSSAVANLSLIFGITGESYDISCACTSGAMAIIAGARLIMSGEYDIVMVGGSEEVAWAQALGFNAMRALSKVHNDTPESASRPFDKSRDGFVIASGAGVMILESEEHAAARGARVISRLTGFATNSNAVDMVMPNADSSAAVMADAVRHSGLQPSDIAYINTHGTSTTVGDPVEMDAIKRVFGNNKNLAINSTKALTGHMIGAAGAVEAIFCTLMLEKGFICKSANLTDPEDEFAWADIVRETREVHFDHALSNSFGFGGTNASLVLSNP